MDDSIDLSPTQTEALDAIVNRGRSGLLTGPGGTGKSFLVREIVSQLQTKGRKVSLTATTGIAAVLIGGVTLMSQFRIFPDDLAHPSSVNIKRMMANKWFAKELRQIHTLIIDEVSMLDADVFRRVHDMLAHLHHSSAPFGGIQVLLVGDFFQLPPIAKSKALEFLFECDLFWETCDAVWELKEVWRQSDPVFAQLLNRVRQGTHTDEDITRLQTRLGASVGTESIIPTQLFSRNINVDGINKSKLDALPGHAHSFSLQIGEHRLRTETSDAVEKLWDTQRDKFKRDVNLPDELVLREGAQILLASNLDTANGLCNGSRGVVVSFSEPTSATVTSADLMRKSSSDMRSAYLGGVAHPLVEFDNGKRIRIPFVRISRKIPDLGEVFLWQIPLRLGWASTIHRMQGQTLTLVNASLDSSVFEVGQAYVALSRARSLEGLTLTSFDPSCIRAHPKVCEFYLKPFALQKGEHLMPKPSKEARVGTKRNRGFEESKSLIVKDDDD